MARTQERSRFSTHGEHQRCSWFDFHWHASDARWCCFVAFYVLLSNNIAGYWRSVVTDLHTTECDTFNTNRFLFWFWRCFGHTRSDFVALRIFLMYDLLPFSYSNFPFEGNKMEKHKTSMPFPFITSREVLVRSRSFSSLDKLHLLKLTKKALRFQLRLGQTDAFVTKSSLLCLLPIHDPPSLSNELEHRVHAIGT